MEKYEKVKKMLEDKGYYNVTIEKDGVYISVFPVKSMIPFQVIDDIIELHGEDSLKGINSILETYKR